MPIRVQQNLPAKKIMENENIFMMDEMRASSQDIRPLEIAILNLMPLKEETEVQLLRCLSNTPLQINITFLTTATYTGKNTPQSHLDQFYQTYEDIKDKKFDGFIITGTPVEQLPFEQVVYWDELKKIMEWSKTMVTSTLHLCWGAQAGIYYHYGINKYELPEKLFGIYEHRVYHRKRPILRGFDDVFYAPHSRYTAVSVEEINRHEDLTLLADSEKAGAFLVSANEGKQIFVFGHPEYDRLTLDREYHRDIEKGLPIDIPYNYYLNNDPNNKPLLKWRSASNCLYTNWLNYYVYQKTPYEL